MADFFIGSDKQIFWNNSLVINHDYSYHMPFIQTLLIKSSVACGIVLAAIICFYRKGFAKILASFLMLLGRLEIFTVMLIFSGGFTKK